MIHERGLIHGHALCLGEQGFGDVEVIGEGVGEGGKGAVCLLVAREGHRQCAGLAQLISEMDRVAGRHRRCPGTSGGANYRLAHVGRGHGTVASAGRVVPEPRRETPTGSKSIASMGSAGMADIDATAVRVPVGLPSAVERLLLDVVADGFVLCCCGGRAEPTALVAFYEWEHYVDLITIREFDRITTGRAPKHDELDVFAPEMVVWAYEGPAESALRALLNLVHPQHPDAPTSTYLAPCSLHVPRQEQRPLTIRPPSVGSAGVRAARLAAAMAKSEPRLVQPNPG